MKINNLLALVLVVGILAIATGVIFKGIGGTEALMLLLGHLLAWGEIVVIFYFRKKPEEK